MLEIFQLKLTPPIDWEARQALGSGPDLFMQEMRDKYGLPGNWDEGSDTLDETIHRLKTYLGRGSWAADKQ